MQTIYIFYENKIWFNKEKIKKLDKSRHFTSVAVSDFKILNNLKLNQQKQMGNINRHKN